VGLKADHSVTSPTVVTREEGTRWKVHRTVSTIGDNAVMNLNDSILLNSKPGYLLGIVWNWHSSRRNVILRGLFWISGGSELETQVSSDDA
jgi:hypothetical protein